MISANLDCFENQILWCIKMIKCIFSIGLENEPPPPGVDGEEKKKIKEEELEDGETKEEKNGEIYFICLSVF